MAGFLPAPAESGLHQAPEVLAVQEVDTLQTLQALAAQINTDDATISYTAFLEEGNDPGGIDVGFLVRDSIQVNSVTQVGLNEINPFDGSLLNDRPPLILDAVYTGGVEPFPFTAIVVHQRSLNGIDDPADGDRVRSWPRRSTIRRPSIPKSGWR